MQNSLGISKTQPESADVLPYPEENINGRNQRNRTDDSPGGGSFPEDLSVDNAQASSVPIGDNDSDRPRSPSDLEGTSPVHHQPRATGKSQPVKKVKTRPGVIQLKDGRFMTRLELAPDATGKRRRKNFTASTQQGAIDKKQAYQINVFATSRPKD